MNLAKDVCEHKLGEVGALLHVRQREVLQEVVQEADETDDLIIDLRSRLPTTRSILKQFLLHPSPSHRTPMPCSTAAGIWSGYRKQHTSTSFS